MKTKETEKEERNAAAREKEERWDSGKKVERTEMN